MYMFRRASINWYKSSLTLCISNLADRGATVVESWSMKERKFLWWFGAMVSMEYGWLNSTCSTFQYTPTHPPVGLGVLTCRLPPSEPRSNALAATSLKKKLGRVTVKNLHLYFIEYFMVALMFFFSNLTQFWNFWKILKSYGNINTIWNRLAKKFEIIWNIRTDSKPFGNFWCSLAIFGQPWDCEESFEIIWKRSG